jgi:hypothetical protein
MKLDKGNFDFDKWLEDMARTMITTAFVSSMDASSVGKVCQHLGTAFVAIAKANTASRWDIRCKLRRLEEEGRRLRADQPSLDSESAQTIGSHNYLVASIADILEHQCLTQWYLLGKLLLQREVPNPTPYQLAVAGSVFLAWRAGASPETASRYVTPEDGEVLRANNAPDEGKRCAADINFVRDAFERAKAKSLSREVGGPRGQVGNFLRKLNLADGF